MESFSLYIHIFSRSQSFLSYLKKSYGALKILKMACSQLVRNLKKKLSKVFSSFKLTTRKIFDYKEKFFLYYVAKSISFEVISILKISTFAAALIILGPLLQFLTQKLKILKFNRNNYYLATEIEKEQKNMYLF